MLYSGGNHYLTVTELPEMMVAKIPFESNYSKLIIPECSEVCQYHNVYSEVEMLDKATDRQRFYPVLENGEPWIAAKYA